MFVSKCPSPVSSIPRSSIIYTNYMAISMWVLIPLVNMSESLLSKDISVGFWDIGLRSGMVWCASTIVLSKVSICLQRYESCYSPPSLHLLTEQQEQENPVKGAWIWGRYFVCDGRGILRGEWKYHTGLWENFLLWDRFYVAKIPAFQCTGTLISGICFHQTCLLSS